MINSVLTPSVHAIACVVWDPQDMGSMWLLQGLLWPSYPDNLSVSFGTVINLNFSGFYFFAYFEAYVRIYQLAKFQVLILINFWIIADSNSVWTILMPLEKHRSVINHAPRACAQVVSASCSHRRVYESNTLNVYRIVINQSRSSICGGFTLRALGNHASNRHKGIRIRVLNVLVH